MNMNEINDNNNGNKKNLTNSDLHYQLPLQAKKSIL